MGHAVVGGPRATLFIRDGRRPVRTVGARLLPGVARLLFGAPADELAGVCPSEYRAAAPASLLHVLPTRSIPSETRRAGRRMIGVERRIP